MISFKHKGNIKRLQIKPNVTSEKLVSAIGRLFPIKGFILGFKSEEDIYYDVDSFINVISSFKNFVVQIVSGSDIQDISFSSDNVSSFVPPERTTSPFLTNKIVYVSTVKEVGNYQNNTIILFVFEQKLKDWILQKINDLSRQYNNLDLLFACYILQPKDKNLKSPMFSIYTNKSKLCQVKITVNFVQQIQRILNQIQIPALQQNSLVKTLKRIQKLDDNDSPSFLTRNIEQVISKDLVLDNLKQMFDEYIITDNELDKLVQLVNSNFIEFCQLFCQNLGDTDYESFKKQIQAHLQRYRILLNSLLQTQRPVSREQQRQKSGNNIEVLKIQVFLEILDELYLLTEEQRASVKRLVLSQNKKIVNEFQKYQKGQVNQMTLTTRLRRILSEVKDQDRPLSRCLPRDRNKSQQKQKQEPHFNFQVLPGQQVFESENSFGVEDKNKEDNLFINNQAQFKSTNKKEYRNLESFYNLRYWEKQFHEMMTKTQLSPKQRQTLNQYFKYQTPQLFMIIRDYVNSKNANIVFENNKIQKYLIPQNKKLSYQFSKLTMFKILIDQLCKQKKVTEVERDQLILGFISQKLSIIGAFENYLDQKNQIQFVETLKLILNTNNNKQNSSFGNFIETSEFFLKNIYQHPNILQYTIKTYPQVFRGICQKQKLSRNFLDLMQNVDILNSYAFSKRFYSQVHKLQIPIKTKTNIIKQFQKGNQELFENLIEVFQNGKLLQEVAKNYDTTERQTIQEILKQLGIMYNNPKVQRAMKYFDTKQPGFCSIWEVYKLTHDKQQFIDNLKIYLNVKEPGMLSQLPMINQSPVLKKRYKQKNDQLFSIIRLLKSSSEEEVSCKLKQFQQKQRLQVVKQTLSNLGLTYEKTKSLLQKHSKEVVGLVLRYLNTNNKQELLFAIEPYLMMLLPEEQKRFQNDIDS